MCVLLAYTYTCKAGKKIVRREEEEQQRKLIFNKLISNNIQIQTLILKKVGYLKMSLLLEANKTKRLSVSL